MNEPNYFKIEIPFYPSNGIERFSDIWREFHRTRYFEDKDFEVKGKVFNFKELPRSRCPFYLENDKLQIVDECLYFMDMEYFILDYFSLKFNNNTLIDDEIKNAIIEWLTYLQKNLFIPFNVVLTGGLAVFLNNSNRIFKVDVIDKSIIIKNYICQDSLIL